MAKKANKLPRHQVIYFTTDKESPSNVFTQFLKEKNHKITHVKIIADSNKKYLHIIGYRYNRIIFDSELIEAKYNVYYGYWKEPAFKQPYLIIVGKHYNDIHFKYCTLKSLKDTPIKRFVIEMERGI